MSETGSDFSNIGRGKNLWLPWFNLSILTVGFECTPPKKPPNGHWNCDKDLEQCRLECDSGYSTVEETNIRY